MAPTLLEQVEDFFAPIVPEKLGLAVSGGGDSVALLHLAHRMSQHTGTKLRVATVDHGLREASAIEAQGVAELARQLGLAHETLHWRGWDGRGNLQNEARIARFHLLADWAHSHGIQMIAQGHNADDQAETVLLRLARRAGVDGLSAMPKRRIEHGIYWVRPLLGARRDELRSYLAENGISWIEDPSNVDERFDRVRARKALGVLGDIGIDAESLCAVADNMARARSALNWQTFRTMREIGWTDAGSVVIDRRGLRTHPDEIQRRLLVRAINWVGQGSYVARHAAISNIMQAVAEGTGATVDGCQVQVWRDRIWVFREYQAVRDSVAPLGADWDGRWRVSTTAPTEVPFEGLELRPLGHDGLQQCPDWRKSGRPLASLLSSPAVWSDKMVVAAPVAGYGQNWYAEIIGGEESFFAVLLAH